jgi:hypothetical protein
MTKRRRLSTLVTAAVAAGLSASLATPPATASGSTVVDTRPAWDGESNIFSFGQPNHTPTYGQTITAPAHRTHLSRFHFIVRIQPQVRFRGYVYAWDEAQDRATGDPVWKGVVRRTFGYRWKRLTLTPNVRLQPLQKYVVFLTTTGVRQAGAQTDSGFFAQVQFQDLYPGGAFVFVNNARKSDWTADGWDGGFEDALGEGGDLAFRAVFS